MRVPPAYYIGPESRVYHDTPDCPALRASHRYYPCREARGQDAVTLRRFRRPCRRCTATA